MAFASYKKVIVSGNVYEFFDFERPAFSDFESKGGRRKKDEEESKRAEENRKTSSHRAREKVRRLINANFSDLKHTKFTTHTFRDGVLENVWDVSEANPLWKKFVMRLKHWLKKNYKTDFQLKYVTVIEFQDKNGRGAVHYHMISNLPYIDQDILQGIWKHGWVGINSLQGKYRESGKDVDNVGAYVVKYMTKNAQDPRLRGQKSYLCSKGLHQPTTFRGDTAELVAESIGIETLEKVFTSEYESEHHGKITYTEYNIKRSKAERCTPIQR